MTFAYSGNEAPESDLKEGLMTHNKNIKKSDPIITWEVICAWALAAVFLGTLAVSGT